MGRQRDDSQVIRDSGFGFLNRGSSVEKSYEGQLQNRVDSRRGIGKEVMSEGVGVVLAAVRCFGVTLEPRTVD